MIHDYLQWYPADGESNDPQQHGEVRFGTLASPVNHMAVARLRRGNFYEYYTRDDFSPYLVSGYLVMVAVVNPGLN